MDYDILAQTDMNQIFKKRYHKTFIVIL